MALTLCDQDFILHANYIKINCPLQLYQQKKDKLCDLTCSPYQKPTVTTLPYSPAVASWLFKWGKTLDFMPNKLNEYINALELYQP